MCQACPGCALANPTRSKSSELIYNFTIKAPFLVMHFNAYAAGTHADFEGSECYLIGCCGMTSFACMEPITNASATTFASAIMKMLLRYGFCHTAMLDKDSKFFGVCSKALDLLKINQHVLSGVNHNPMLVERVNCYLTRSLKIMCNERDYVRVAFEAILLLLYAWNLCPLPGLDISCSLVAVGREFAFPIDYSSGRHWELTSSPSTVVSYSKELATRLSACCGFGLKNSIRIIVNSSTCTALNLISILLATLSSRDTRLGQMQREALSTNSNMRLLDCGVSTPS